MTEMETFVDKIKKYSEPLALQAITTVYSGLLGSIITAGMLDKFIRPTWYWILWSISAGLSIIHCNISITEEWKKALSQSMPKNERTGR